MPIISDRCKKYKVQEDVGMLQVFDIVGFRGWNVKFSPYWSCWYVNWFSFSLLLGVFLCAKIENIYIGATLDLFIAKLIASFLTKAFNSCKYRFDHNLQRRINRFFVTAQTECMNVSWNSELQYHYYQKCVACDTFPYHANIFKV